MLASFNFTLEYQKGSDNLMADTLSQTLPPASTKDILETVQSKCSQKGIKSLLENSLIGVSHWAEVHLLTGSMAKELERQEEEMFVRAQKMTPMHVTDWVQAQDEDAELLACHHWTKRRKQTSLKEELVDLAMSSKRWELYCV